MRTFKTKSFTRFAEKAGISDATLCRSVRDAQRGLVAAELGGGVIKQRLARPGQGKSGGFRTLIVFKAGTRAVFVSRFRQKHKRQHREGRTGGAQETRRRAAGL